MITDDYEEYFSDSTRLAPVQPEPDKPIIRIFPKWKLESLLLRKSLYFCRVNQFWKNDPNEGLWTSNEDGLWRNTNFNAQNFNQFLAQKVGVSCWSIIENLENKKYGRHIVQKLMELQLYQRLLNLIRLLEIL